MPFHTNDYSGQRYDVIVEANQDSDNYWMRAIPQSACSENDSSDNIKGIVRYDSTSTDDPDTSAYDYDDDCIDEDVSDLVPIVSETVGTLSNTDTDDNELGVAVARTSGLFKWRIGSTTMAVEWADPSLLQIYNGSDDWSSSDAVIELADADEWVYFIIETTLAVPHPIHLHGHDFYILAQAESSTYSSSVTLNYDNPPRRDVATLPSAGYLVLAFKTDNPGAWLMHCHIGWHTSEGLALQFIERYDDIAALIDSETLSDTCSTWETYADDAGLTEEDSGV